MPQDHFEAPVVTVEHAVEKTLRVSIDSIMPFRFCRPKKPAAEHGGQGQGDKAGDQNGNADRYSKFMKQPSNDPTHEEDGNEDGNEGEGHGDDRETDLFRALEARL